MADLTQKGTPLPLRRGYQPQAHGGPANGKPPVPPRGGSGLPAPAPQPPTAAASSDKQSSRP